MIWLAERWEICWFRLGLLSMYLQSCLLIRTDQKLLHNQEETPFWTEPSLEFWFRGGLIFGNFYFFLYSDPLIASSSSKFNPKMHQKLSVFMFLNSELRNQKTQPWNLRTQRKFIESWCLFYVFSESFGLNFEDEGGRCMTP